MKIQDLTIRELQTQLPWTVHYHRDFRISPMAHKDFGHALLHVQKAAGKLASVVNDAEHGGSDFTHEEVDRFVADLVVCALRMANTCPGRTIDLQRAVEDRIESRNEARLSRTPSQPDIAGAIAKLLRVADTNPFCSVGNFLEHVAPELRDAAPGFAPQKNSEETQI